MSTSTSGIKLDTSTKERIRQAAAALDRTPHWFMKKAVLYWLERVEEGSGVSDMLNEIDLEDDLVNSVLGRQQLLNVTS